MKKLVLLFLLFLLSVNSYAGAICNDGWISKSSGSGTCSWHGGVKKWLDDKEPNTNDYRPERNKKNIGSPCGYVPLKKRQQCLERQKVSHKAAFAREEELIKNHQEGMKIIAKRQEFLNDMRTLSFEDFLKKYSIPE